ncbi:MAG TPA: ATP-grasp domain-containing protein [Candidatus Acidoferrum sp.]|nr:ATP-grasp domain-containing protein [Candidatus Acidoferrum sp.]
MGTNPNSPSRSKRLLLLASKLGYQTLSFAEAARKLGVELIYATDRCHQLDDPWNDRAIPVHFETPEGAAAEILETLRGSEPDGILALGDRSVITAAYAARGFGVFYNHPASVEACRNKEHMRAAFRDAGLRVPWFRTLPLNPTPDPALAGVQFPCVVKPLCLSASQGVMRANNPAEFKSAVERIARILRSPDLKMQRDPNHERVLVEAYIPGREVAVEGMLTEGALRVLAIFDKPDPLDGPFFEETIYVTPSRLSAEQQNEIARTAAEAARALGLIQGPIHAEFRVNENGVWPLEIAPRPIGGLCARALRFSLGMISLEELLVRHALQMPGSDLEREPNASGVMMIPVPATGVLEHIDGLEAAAMTPHVEAIEITARLHDTVVAWPEGSSYPGFIFARAGSPEEVERALREAHAKLHFVVTPELPVSHPATGQLPVVP